MMVLEKKKTREELKQTYKDLKRSGASVETNNNNRTWKYTCVHMKIYNIQQDHSDIFRIRGRAQKQQILSLVDE